MATTDLSQPGPLAMLRRLAQSRPRSHAQCEVCGAPIDVDHAHLLSLQSRQILCACPGCAVLFSDPRGPRFRRLSRRAERLPEFQMTDELWNGLLIPINLAFFFFNSKLGREVAMYPSPAGATESLLELESWRELVAANPLLDDFAPDIEALLVNRMGERADYYWVSIDKCYELVGLIRMHWRGLSGGQEVWRRLQAFFEQLTDDSAGADYHG